MTRKISKEALKEYALNEAGANMIGIASIERFDDCPPDFHPHRLNDRARTVIVVGLRILRGSMRGFEQGTSRIPYNTYGYGGIDHIHMRDTLYRLGGYIEDHGFEAVPTLPWTGMPPLEPIINHRLAAVAAGLGEIGYSKVLLTDKFGPMQRPGIMLTDAEIEPDPIKEPGICDKSCRVSSNARSGQ